MNMNIIFVIIYYKYYIPNMKASRDPTKIRFEELQKRMSAIDLPIPGTIHELYARCGSPNCPCATDDTKRHGPYLRWHHKIRGRQYAIGISEETKTVIEAGIKNREKIEGLFEAMLEIGADDAKLRNVNFKSASENRKKT
jgi:hypothetical protein